MSASMIALIVVLGALSLLSLVWVKPIKAGKPTGTRQAVQQLGSWFLGAWVVSEFGSYALADYGVVIGYWQAFFGLIAVRALVSKAERPTWSEYDAASRHEQAED